MGLLKMGIFTLVGRKLGNKTIEAQSWKSDRLYLGQGGEQSQKGSSPTTLDSRSWGSQVLGRQPLHSNPPGIMSSLFLARPAKLSQATVG